MSMCIENTPLEYHSDLELYVKREDLCCPGGPNFSKTRGVFAHIRNRNEDTIGVLDTSHSQGGWAVARACSILGKQCVVYYPLFKKDRGWSPSQVEAHKLGARIAPLGAGRSAILYHRAKKCLLQEQDSAILVEEGKVIDTYEQSTYMMPNALKLVESVNETALEFCRTSIPRKVDTIIVSASSGTIAAGVILGAHKKKWNGRIIVHLGYSRPADSVRKYMAKMNGLPHRLIQIVDEGYSYADEARPGLTPKFQCNSFYDLKSLRWWVHKGRLDGMSKHALFWNIG